MAKLTGGAITSGDKDEGSYKDAFSAVDAFYDKIERSSFLDNFDMPDVRLNVYGESEPIDIPADIVLQGPDVVIEWIIDNLGLDPDDLDDLWIELEIDRDDVLTYNGE